MKKRVDLIITYIKIIVGTGIMAVGICQFLLPNHLSTGGFSGLATIGYYLFKIPMGVIVFILNIPAFAITYFKIGKEFFIKSILGTGFLSIFLSIFESYPSFTNDRFLACIYGGILVGFGTSLVLKAKGSTGGSDLIANIVRKYTTRFRTGTVIVIVDVVIVTLNMIFFKEVEIGLYSAIAIYLLGKIVDIFFEGIDFTKQIYIISAKNEEISKKISNDIGRGLTGIYGKGMYKQKDMVILLCVASRPEVMRIIQIIKKIDPQAFTIVSNAREVIGQGFEK